MGAEGARRDRRNSQAKGQRKTSVATRRLFFCIRSGATDTVGDFLFSRKNKKRKDNEKMEIMQNIVDTIIFGLYNNM